VEVSSGFDAKRIEKIPDEGIQQELTNHIQSISEHNADLPADGRIDPFGNEGMEILNRNRNRPLVKVTTYEESSSKFEIRPGQFTEADKGTNLYFVIYVNENDPSDRTYETISLRRVIEAKMKGEHFVEHKEGYRWFLLSPGDLVYLPKANSEIGQVHAMDVYKMVSATRRECYFIPNSVSTVIKDKVEFELGNKSERALDHRMIKQHCFKIHVDRIGNFVFNEFSN
jgi:CRISPR-associated endonuclease Csn1